jgi:hypothetical protein
MEYNNNNGLLGIISVVVFLFPVLISFVSLPFIFGYYIYCNIYGITEVDRINNMRKFIEKINIIKMINDGLYKVYPPISYVLLCSLFFLMCKVVVDMPMSGKSDIHPGGILLIINTLFYVIFSSPYQEYRK